MFRMAGSSFGSCSDSSQLLRGELQRNEFAADERRKEKASPAGATFTTLAGGISDAADLRQGPISRSGNPTQQTVTSALTPILTKLHALPAGRRALDSDVIKVLKLLKSKGKVVHQYMAFDVPLRGSYTSSSDRHCNTSDTNCNASATKGRIDSSSCCTDADSNNTEGNKEKSPLSDRYSQQHLSDGVSSTTYIIVDCSPSSGVLTSDTIVYLKGATLQPLRRVQLLALVHPNSVYARRAGITCYQQVFEEKPSFPSLDQCELHTPFSAHSSIANVQTLREDQSPDSDRSHTAAALPPAEEAAEAETLLLQAGENCADEEFAARAAHWLLHDSGFRQIAVDSAAEAIHADSSHSCSHRKFERATLSDGWLQRRKVLRRVCEVVSTSSSQQPFEGLHTFIHSERCHTRNNRESSSGSNISSISGDSSMSSSCDRSCRTGCGRRDIEKTCCIFENTGESDRADKSDMRAVRRTNTAKTLVQKHSGNTVLLHSSSISGTEEKQQPQHMQISSRSRSRASHTPSDPELASSHPLFNATRKRSLQCRSRSGCNIGNKRSNRFTSSTTTVNNSMIDIDRNVKSSSSSSGTNSISRTTSIGNESFPDFPVRDISFSNVSNCSCANLKWRFRMKRPSDKKQKSNWLNAEALFNDFVEPYLVSKMQAKCGREKHTIDGNKVCEKKQAVVLYPGKQLTIKDVTFVVWATEPSNEPGLLDEKTSIYISLDPYGEYRRVHFVPFSDTLPTTYIFNFYEDYLKPFLLENKWRNFRKGDIFSYRGVDFKLIATQPSYCTTARVGPATIVHFQGTVQPTIMDVLPSDLLHHIRRMPARMQPFAIISAAQRLDPEILMRVVPSNSRTRGHRGISDRVAEALREKLVKPFKFADYAAKYPDMCCHASLCALPEVKDSVGNYCTNFFDKCNSSSKRPDSPLSLAVLESQVNGEQGVERSNFTTHRRTNRLKGGKCCSSDKPTMPGHSGGHEKRLQTKAESSLCQDASTGYMQIKGKNVINDYTEQSKRLLDFTNKDASQESSGGATFPAQVSESFVDCTVGEQHSRKNYAKCHLPASKNLFFNKSQSELIGCPERPSCTVCTLTMEDGDTSILLLCGHIFHWHCVLAWWRSNSTCPNCRASIVDLVNQHTGAGQQDLEEGSNREQHGWFEETAADRRRESSPGGQLEAGVSSQGWTELFRRWFNTSV